MRKNEKDRCLEMADTLLVAHEEVRRNLEYENEAGASELLSQCQQAAISLGEFIEEIDEASAVTDIVKSLEDYCERVFRIHEQIITPSENRVYSRLATDVCSELNDSLSVAKQKMASISEKIDVVFFPYKASMWDSLESVWMAANEDPCCNAYVIPIPYYDRNPDGTLGKMHYEAGGFEKTVPIVSYESYNVEIKRPDMIFIHNPFDESNNATSVHPFYYSKNLKRYTDHLVYIPYFISSISDERCKSNPFIIKGNIDNAATVHAHHIIQQSEAMAQACINVMTSLSGEKTSYYWENKFMGIGSPKVDKMLSVYNEVREIAEEWKNQQNPKKGVVLYNSGVMAMLSGNCKTWIEKTKNDLAYFGENGVFVIWRPHPLLMATFEAMRPDNVDEYLMLTNWFMTNHIGILDESPNVELAIARSDVFTGDYSSIEMLCKTVGIPAIYDREEVVKKLDNIEFYEKMTTIKSIKNGDTVGKKVYKAICKCL